MSIEWHRVDRVVICPKEFSVTLLTKEGYAMAKSTYNTLDGAMFNADKCFKLMIKAKEKK